MGARRERVSVLGSGELRLEEAEERAAARPGLGPGAAAEGVEDEVQLGDILKTIEGLKHFAEESHSVAKRHDDELIRISKLEKSISKSDSVLKSIESVVSSHALEVDRIARIENRLDQYETASKKLENLVDEKLKFY